MPVPESLQAGWVEQMKTERNYHYLHGTDEELWCEDTVNALAKVREGVWERQELDLCFLNYSSGI